MRDFSAKNCNLKSDIFREGVKNLKFFSLSLSLWIGLVSLVAAAEEIFKRRSGDGRVRSCTAGWQHDLLDGNGFDVVVGGRSAVKCCCRRGCSWFRSRAVDSVHD